MAFVFYLIIYLVISLVVTYLLACTFGLNESLPERRVVERRILVRQDSEDRRASSRLDRRVSIRRYNGMIFQTGFKRFFKG